MANSDDKTIKSNFKDLFWELIPDFSFDVTSHGNINNAFKIIRFYRDENYELKCRLEANVGDDIKTRMQLSPFQNKLNRDAGVLSAGDDLFAQKYNFTAGIKGFHYNRMDANQDPCFIEGDAYQIHIASSKTSEETEFIHYWYLNGLGENGPFCRSSEAEFKTSLKLRIDDIEKEIERPAFGGVSIDCMRLSINNKKFVFGRINEIFSEDIPCSYLRFTKESLPTKEELEAIENTLSFIFGKIFLYVGYSKYNADYFLIERLFQDPYMYDASLSKIKKLAAFEPFIISRKKIGDGEIIINQMLDKYFESLKAFPLNEVVEAINMFRLFPFDLKIMPLSVAIDLLKNAWFRSDRSPSKGKHLGDDNYNTVISKYLVAIKTDLKNFFNPAFSAASPSNEVPERLKPIINRIEAANNMSNNERIMVFFKELGLNISQAEETALRTRNIVVHGSSKERNDQQFIDNVYIYYTLLNKVVLKLLSYDGFYLDYGTHGHPQRHMTLPITSRS